MGRIIPYIYIYIFHILWDLLVGGWPTEKYEFVSWDDDIPNWMENNPNVPIHQPVYQHVRKTVVSTGISSIVFNICWGPNGHRMGFSNVSWHKNRRTFWNILESVDVAPLILRFLGFVSTICDRIAPFPLSYHPQRNHGLVGDKELSLGPWDKGVLH